MLKVHKYGGGLVVLALLAGLLAGCGDPTPTPLPPTPTPLPPTATTVALPPTSTSMAGGSPATTADLALITEALTTTRALTSYHYTIGVNGDMTGTVQAEGDYVGPNSGYIKATAGTTTGEQLTLGSKFYHKESGKWVDGPIALPTGAEGIGGDMGLDASTLTRETNLFNVPLLQSLFGAGTNYRDAGNETRDGVALRHFTFDVDLGVMLSGGLPPDPNSPPTSLGSGAFWIDPATKRISQIEMRLDIGPLLALVDVAQALGNTPVPGVPTPTPLPANYRVNVDLTLSQPNAPITLPTP